MLLDGVSPGEVSSSSKVSRGLFDPCIHDHPCIRAVGPGGPPAGPRHEAAVPFLQQVDCRQPLRVSPVIFNRGREVLPHIFPGIPPAVEGIRDGDGQGQVSYVSKVRSLFADR